MGTGHMEVGKSAAYRKPINTRLFNDTTGMWLHYSGNMETPRKSEAWGGYVHQAAELERRADDWPYRRVAIIHKRVFADKGMQV